MQRATMTMRLRGTMTRRHYTRLANWIAQNSEPGSESREAMIQTAFFIIKMDDEQKGNKKLFDSKRFRQFIENRSVDG